MSMKEYMLKKNFSKIRKDEYGAVIQVTIKNDGTAMVNNFSGTITHLYKKFPRTQAGLDEALSFYDGVLEMTALTELAMEAEMNRYTLH